MFLRESDKHMKQIDKKNAFCSLVECEAGEEVQIVDIDAGHRARINLTGLGLNIGDTISIQRKSHFHGPVVVFHRGSEIALGFGLSQKILVQR